MNDIDARMNELYDEGYFCAETVLMVVAEREGIKSKIIPRIATGLCAGFARTSGLCGALSGAILALNMIYGRDLPHEPKDKNYEVVEKIIGMFEEKFGSTNCTELCECDLRTKEGQIKFVDENIIEKKCIGYSIVATKMVIQILEESNRK